MERIETLLLTLVVYIILRDSVPMILELASNLRRRLAEKKAMRDNLDKIGRSDDETDR